MGQYLGTLQSAAMVLLTVVLYSSLRLPLRRSTPSTPAASRSIFSLRIMSVLPQSRPSGASPSARIPTVDNSGRGVSLAALAGTPDNVLRTKFPPLAQALDHFAKASGSRFSLKITVSTHPSNRPNSTVADLRRRA